MAPVQSRVSPILAQLTSRFETAVAGRDPLPVVGRGPVLSSSRARIKVYVGYDGDPAGENRAVDVTRVWKGQGAKTRDETITVYNAVVITTGSNSAAAIAQAQDDAMATFIVLEESVLGGLDMGQPLPAKTSVNDLGMYVDQPVTGLAVRLTFQTITECRLTRI